MEGFLSINNSVNAAVTVALFCVAKVSLQRAMGWPVLELEELELLELEELELEELELEELELDELELVLPELDELELVLPELELELELLEAFPLCRYRPVISRKHQSLKVSEPYKLLIFLG